MNVRVTERCEKSCKSQNGEGHNDGCKEEQNYTCAKTQIGEARPDYLQKLKVPEGYEKSNENRNI